MIKPLQAFGLTSLFWLSFSPLVPQVWAGTPWLETLPQQPIEAIETNPSRSYSASDLLIGDAPLSSPLSASSETIVSAQSDSIVQSLGQAVIDAVGTLVQDPTRLEISLSRRQVTFYLDGMRQKSYPIAVGRAGWRTPTGKFKVRQKLKNPAWIHPLTNERIAGGDPANPLGSYWIGFWTDGKNWVGFHGTPNPESVGRAVSHGCIRMYNKDIQELFPKISMGTPVIVKE